MSWSSPPNTRAEAASDSARRVFPATVPIPGGSLPAPGLAEIAGPRRIDPFRLGRTPVTNLEFGAFLAAGIVAAPPWWGDPRFAGDRRPVVGVSWDDATAFCAWLNGGGEHAEEEPAPGRWRLPSDAEWEFAMRGGQLVPDPRTPWGDAVPEGEIPQGPLEGPWETGRGTPNGYGILDPGTMVHEWCLNWSLDASGAAPRRRASKGGSWRHAVRWSAPSASSSLPPEFRYSDYGFRVLFEPDGFRVLREIPAPAP
ncbi:MAG TPA: SUMF1/EgtB/PvdO family nonheme iron enzyme [Thermoanaerobaculia bacterium]